jgi:hypothetical protein
MSSNYSEKSILELIDTVLFEPKWMQKPYSWVGHIPFVSWLVRVAKPRIIVELGTHSGNSYFSICQAVKQYETGSKCFAVDTWQGDAHAFTYGGEIFEMVQNHNLENYASISTLLKMTFDEALSKFKDHSVDLLHIDGLHTYEAVKHDFETWLPKLAQGAIVLFHDTHVQKDDFGVYKYWSELKKQYPHHFEFCYSHGLGVLQISNASNGLNSGHSFFLGDVTQQEILCLSALGKKTECLEEMALLDDANQKHLNQMRALWSERDQLAASLTSLKTSFSWRITAPIRLMASGFLAKSD